MTARRCCARSTSRRRCRSRRCAAPTQVFLGRDPCSCDRTPVSSSSARNSVSAARRLGDRRLAPGRPDPGPRRVLAALRSPGARGGARHLRARRARRGHRARRGDRQSVGPRRRLARVATATSTARRSATCSTSSRSPSPTSPRCPSVAPTGCSTSTAAYGLPPFLADEAGVDSGSMIAQYAQAALVTEMKRLASPASVDSIPSSGMQEDHVSMGWHAARKLRQVARRLPRRAWRSNSSPARARSRFAHRSARHRSTAAVADRVNARLRRARPRPVALTGDRGGERTRRAVGELLDIASRFVTLQ